MIGAEVYKHTSQEQDRCYADRSPVSCREKSDNCRENTSAMVGSGPDTLSVVGRGYSHSFLKRAQECSLARVPHPYSDRRNAYLLPCQERHCSGNPAIVKPVREGDPCFLVEEPREVLGLQRRHPSRVFEADRLANVLLDELLDPPKARVTRKGTQKPIT